MAYVAFSLKDNQQTFKFFYFSLMLLFLVYGSYQVVLLAGEPVVMLNYTAEDSHVWNCSDATYDCFGEPEDWSCWAYNETQCTAISGCTWSVAQAYCSGTPEWTCEELYVYGGEEKCGETKGCYMWNETLPHTCDTYVTHYNYANYSSGYENYGDSFLSIAYVLGLLVFLMVAYNLLTYGFSMLDRGWGKGKGPGNSVNEYEQPF